MSTLPFILLATTPPDPSVPVLLFLFFAALIAAITFVFLFIGQLEAKKFDDWTELPNSCSVGIRQPGVEHPSLDTKLACIALAGRFLHEQLLIVQRQLDADRIRAEKQASEQRGVQEQLLAELNQFDPTTAGPTWSPSQDA